MNMYYRQVYGLLNIPSMTYLKQAILIYIYVPLHFKLVIHLKFVTSVLLVLINHCMSICVTSSTGTNFTMCKVGQQ